MVLYAMARAFSMLAGKACIWVRFHIHMHAHTCAYTIMYAHLQMLLQLLIAGLSSHPRGQSMSPSQIHSGSAQILGPPSAPHGILPSEQFVSVSLHWKRMSTPCQETVHNESNSKNIGAQCRQGIREEMWLNTFNLYHSLCDVLSIHT